VFNSKVNPTIPAYFQWDAIKPLGVLLCLQDSYVNPPFSPALPL